MTKTTLTGKRRHRIKARWLRVPILVLQVETHTTGYDIELNGGVIDSLNVNYFSWRDANLEDISTMLAN